MLHMALCYVMHTAVHACSWCVHKRSEMCRSSVKKINLQEPLGFTAAFNGPHGPGVLAIARTADAEVSWLLLLLPAAAAGCHQCCLHPMFAAHVAAACIVACTVCLHCHPRS